MGITREALRNGNVLTHLVDRLRDHKTEQNFIAVLRCLRDSHIWVPMNVRASKEDIEQFVSSNAGDVVKTQSDIGFRPDLLRSDDGELFLPVFSQPNQMPEDYRARFSTLCLPFLQCIDLARAHPELNKIVINAFTKSLVLSEAAFEIIVALPSELEDQTEQ